MQATVRGVYTLRRMQGVSGFNGGDTERAKVAVVALCDSWGALMEGLKRVSFRGKLQSTASCYLGFLRVFQVYFVYNQIMEGE